MNSRITAHLCAAGVLAMGVVAGAQQPSSTTAGTPSQSATTTAGAAGQQTITGCVVSESDYRKMHDAGRGGVAGTGAGVGNEYILVNAASGAAGAAGSTASTSSSVPSATGTSGSTASSASAMAYELTGSGEGQLNRYVGRRVELTGMFKGGETSASGQATGGPTAGAPPRGVDVGGKDLQLREFEVASVKEAQGDCSMTAR